jgi:hypothetical protein
MQTTSIVDTMFAPDGSLISTTLSITPTVEFIGPDGSQITQQTVTVKVTAGALSVNLAPNLGASPIGTSYRVTYQTPDSNRIQEFWIVPQSGSPVNLAAVRVPQIPPLPQPQIPYTQVLDLLSSFGFTPYNETNSPAVGHNDLAIAGAGYQGTMNVNVHNTTGSPITCFSEFKDTGGNYWRIPFENTVIAPGATQLFTWSGIILNQGEGFSLNASAIGLQVNGTYNSFSNTSNVYTTKVFGLANPGTLYTASGDVVVLNPQIFGSYGSPVGIANLTGSAQSSVKLLYTPSGGSAQEISAAASLANNYSLLFNGGLGMHGGDTLSVTGAPGDWGWVTVVEL